MIVNGCLNILEVGLNLLDQYPTKIVFPIRAIQIEI